MSSFAIRLKRKSLPYLPRYRNSSVENRSNILITRSAAQRLKSRSKPATSQRSSKRWGGHAKMLPWAEEGIPLVHTAPDHLFLFKPAFYLNLKGIFQVALTSLHWILSSDHHLTLLSELHPNSSVPISLSTMGLCSLSYHFI